MENKNYIVAIDLGSNNVVVAVGTKSADNKIIIEDTVIKESKGIVRGEVKNVELAAQSLKEALTEIEERLGINIDQAYTGISGSHIKCAKHPYYVYVGSADGEIFEKDVVKLNESMRNVQAPEGYKLMHIIPQHYLVNEEEEVSDPVGMFGKTLGSTFNLLIGEKIILSRLDKALQKVGIKQAGLFINPLAMADAVTFPDEKDLGVGVIDLGAGTTDVCIYHDGIVRYLSVIPLGTEAINKDIRSYGIMERYVEELKIKYGCAVASHVDDEKLVKVPGRTPNDHKEISFRNLASIIEARLNDIIDFVIEEIKESGYWGKLSAGLILTGGGSLTKEIKDLFETRTGLEVRIASPDILVADESKDKASDPRLSAVVGIMHAGMVSGGELKLEKRPEIKKPTVPPAEKDNAAATTPDDTLGEDMEDTEAEDTRKQKNKKPKPPKKGLIQKLKERFEKTFDFDVLDDDNTI